MKKLYLALIVLCTAFVARSQPANNDCSSASYLTFTSNCNLTQYNNNGATLSGDAVASCGYYPNTDVWFKFVVPSSGNIAIKTNYINVRTDMAVYLGSCDSLTQYRCDVGSGQDYLMPYIEFHDTSIAGDTMFLQYWGHNTDTGRFFLCVFEPDQPVNHHCDSAISLTVQQDFNYSYFTNAHAGSSDEPAPPCGAYRTDDVWFKTTVPSSGKLILRTVDNGLGNAVMGVYTGDCDSLSIYQCNDNGGPNYLQAQIYIDDTDLANEEIKIRIWKYNSIFGGGFGIVAMEPQLDSNNTIEGASYLNPQANCNWQRFNMSNYTNSGLVSPPCGAFIGPDIWFKTVIPQSGNVVLTVRDVNSGNMAMAMYTGTPDTLTLYECDDNSAPYYVQPELVINDSTIAGDTVYIVVWEYNSNFPNSFEICCHEPNLPDNRECETATTLQVKPSCNYERFSNEYAKTSGDGLPTCGAYSGTDVWFKFTAPNSGDFTIDTRAAGASNFAMALYTGSCGSLTQYACDANSSSNGNNMPKLVVSDTNLGEQTLYLQVWRYNQNNGGSFDICIYGDLSPQIFNPQGATICEGEDIPPLSVFDGVFSYNWYSTKTGGTLLSSDTNQYTPSSAGTYWVEAVNSETLERSVRTGITLVINPSPEILNPQSQLYCSYESPSALSISDLGDLYQWYADSDLSTLLATDTANYLPSSAGTYYVVAEKRNTGCKDVQSLIFTKVQRPVIAANRNVMLCNDQLPASIGVQDQDLVYHWYTDRSGNSLLAADTPQLSVSIGGTYYVQAVEPIASCVSLMDSIVAVVNQTPSIITGFDKVICSSDLPVILSVTDQGMRYDWFTDRHATDLLATNSSTYQTNTMGRYYVKATNPQSGCSSNIDSIELKVNSEPKIVGPMGFVSCSDEAYQGLRVEDKGDIYNWYSDSVNGSLMASNTEVYMASINGVYYVEAVDPVTSCASADREAVELLIFPDQDPLIAYDGDSLHTTQFSSYQWFRNGLAIFGATSRSHDVTASGMYYVEVIDSNGCQHLSNEVEIESTLSIGGSLTYELNIWPNPTSDFVDIKLRSALIGETLLIKNIQGQLVYSSRILSTKQKIDLSSLPSGMYFIGIESSSKSHYSKLIKQ